MREPSRPPRTPWLPLAVLLLVTPLSSSAQIVGGDPISEEEALPVGCGEMVRARVVALDQPFMWNRYGAVQPQGMMYALERDVVDTDDPDGLPSPGETQALVPGQVRLRIDKRPRPLVLRVNAGQCLRIYFRNLLFPTKPTDFEHQQQPATRAASIHVVGMQLVKEITDDGSFVGANPTGVALPGERHIYTLYAQREGGFVMHSMGAIAGGEGDGGSISAGLFGAVVVEPAGSEWYRSQITREDFELVQAPSPDLFPRVNYGALYPGTHPHYPNLPVLKMKDANGFIVHSDLTAIITGPGAGNLTGYLPSTAVYPERSEPFREFVAIFHDEIGAMQAFPHFEHRRAPLHAAQRARRFRHQLRHRRHRRRDPRQPAEGRAGARLRRVQVRGVLPDLVGGRRSGDDRRRAGERAVQREPEGPAQRAALRSDAGAQGRRRRSSPTTRRTSTTVSQRPREVPEPARRLGRPPHLPPARPPVDRTRRGATSPPISTARRSARGPASPTRSPTRVSGNRNKTVGDAIFHCHFYPHFAQGMWGLWRVHDVLESGHRARRRPAGRCRARGRCRTARSPAARRSRPWCRSRPCPWRRCRGRWRSSPARSRCRTR